MLKSVTKSAFALIIEQGKNKTKEKKRKKVSGAATQTLSRAFVASWLITAGKSSLPKPHKAFCRPPACAKLSCQETAPSQIAGNSQPRLLTAGEVQTDRHHRTWGFSDSSAATRGPSGVNLKCSDFQTRELPPDGNWPCGCNSAVMIWIGTSLIYCPEQHQLKCTVTVT